MQPCRCPGCNQGDLTRRHEGGARGRDEGGKLKPEERDLCSGSLTANYSNYANGDWDILTAEMKRYEYVISATGHISYNAPSGYHDDCVIALALANQGRWQAGNAGLMLRVAGGGQ